MLFQIFFEDKMVSTEKTYNEKSELNLLVKKYTDCKELIKNDEIGLYCLDNLEGKVRELSDDYFISKVLNLSAPIVK